MPTLADLINPQRQSGYFARGLNRPSGNIVGQYIQGVAQRTMHPLETLAGEAERYRTMPTEELMGSFGPSGGGLAGIVSPKVARTLSTSRQLPEDELFRQAVSGTPGAKITDEGLSMQLQRNQQYEQSLEPSVRGGVFYLPEGAAQAKYYGTGKSGYGGAEKITGETLISNPLFVKGATGGKAPEAALDKLKGKGAYQEMRNEALKTMGYGIGFGEKVNRVRNFLDKHAPELSDQAEYIVQNSGSGNQLAYALQEAAVGSAVRSAGHDVVLGHSKGKKGPFLSEIFDVREINYPDVEGTPTDIWEKYK